MAKLINCSVTQLPSSDGKILSKSCQIRFSSKKYILFNILNIFHKLFKRNDSHKNPNFYSTIAALKESQIICICSGWKNLYLYVFLSFLILKCIYVVLVLKTIIFLQIAFTDYYFWEKNTSSRHVYINI